MENFAELIALIESKQTANVKFRLNLEVLVDDCVEDVIELDESYSFEDIGLMCEDLQGMHEA
jgi:hypothetical protein